MKRDSRLSGVLHVLLHMAEQRLNADVRARLAGHRKRVTLDSAHES